MSGPCSNDRRRLLGDLDCSTSAFEVRAHGEVDRVPFPSDQSPVRDDPRTVAGSLSGVELTPESKGRGPQRQVGRHRQFQAHATTTRRRVRVTAESTQSVA